MTITRLTTTTALTRAWTALTHGLRFGGHSVWLMLLDDEHRPIQPVIELEHAQTPPDLEQLRPLVEFVAELVPGRACRIAVLRSRPGHGLPDDVDRVWADALREAAAAAGVSCLAVHFANDEHLVALPTSGPGPVQRQRGA